MQPASRGTHRQIRRLVLSVYAGGPNAVCAAQVVVQSSQHVEIHPVTAPGLPRGLPRSERYGPDRPYPVDVPPGQQGPGRGRRGAPVCSWTRPGTASGSRGAVSTTVNGPGDQGGSSIDVNSALRGWRKRHPCRTLQAPRDPPDRLDDITQTIVSAAANVTKTDGDLDHPAHRVDHGRAGGRHRARQQPAR